ncbi:MAG: BREX-3 system phosphatase PglZ [Desulforudis sp.]|jgi:hypothetical protein|nr:MAG: BREX-3 system phosphatase PglZ [Desulforudis sp.]
MSSWRDQILKELTPKVARLTLVADPDGLLLEEGILEGIHERGFELIPFEDHIAFRYAYESGFRSRWDLGEQTELIVVMRSPASDLGELPYDLLQAGRKLSFNLGDIFPNLSYPVVAALDRGDLAALYDAQKRHTPGRLGDNATKDFILLHVFQIAPELYKETSDLLLMLIRRHYHDQQIPPSLDERLIQLLGQNDTFDDWPLEVLISDREVFFTFLQERWPYFLDRMTADGEASDREGGEPYKPAVKGPIDLPFDHHDIRVYIDNLFLEGLLRSVPHAYSDALSKTWVNVGVLSDPVEDRSRRLGRLLDNLEESVPVEDAKYTDWFSFARGWAELSLIVSGQPGVALAEIGERVKSLQAKLGSAFSAWLLKRYAGLVNLPPAPPVMLHHIPRFLARQIEEGRSAKVAMLLVDGLSLGQWMVIRDALPFREAGLRFKERAVFAWIPSLTSVSRQAAFAGKAPLFFPNSINGTEKEPSLWTQFWADQGHAPNEVIYMKGLGEGNLDAVSEALSHPKVKIAGLVVDKVDKIMHGMQLGAAGMYNQVRQWATQPYLNSLINLLLDHGFHIYLTSDHGNIEAEGCGKPAEGAVADLRGERVRIYSDEGLRGTVKEGFPSALAWEPIGLPKDYLALLAPVGQAFVQEGKNTVCHGGISIEELIVPLVQITRRSG